jgi:hypothetical protein
MNRTHRKKHLVGGFSFYNKTIKNKMFNKVTSSEFSSDKQEKIVLKMLQLSKKLDLSSEEKDNISLTKITSGRGESAVYTVDIKNSDGNVAKSFIYKQSSYKQRSAPREFINSDILSTQLTAEFQKYAGGYYPFPKVYDMFVMNNGVTFAMFTDKFAEPRYVSLNDYFKRDTVNMGMVVNVILNLLFILYVIHRKFPFFQHQNMHPQNIFVDIEVEKKINISMGTYEISIIPNIYLIDFDMVVGLPSFAHSPPLKNRKVTMAFSEMCGSVTQKVVKDFMISSPISLYNLSDYEFINSIYICLTNLVSKTDKNITRSFIADGFITKKMRDGIKRKKAEILCSEYNFIPYELNNIKAGQPRAKSNNELYDSILAILKQKYGFSESIHVITVDDPEVEEDSAPLQDATAGVIADLLRDDSVVEGQPQEMNIPNSEAFNESLDTFYNPRETKYNYQMPNVPSHNAPGPYMQLPNVPGPYMQAPNVPGPYMQAPNVQAPNVQAPNVMNPYMQ